MPAFAANLTMMFGEWSFLDRFDAAAQAGFKAVEFLFPYEHTPDQVARRLSDNGLHLALFNLPPGDWAAGERGLAALPDRFEELKAGVDTALTYVQATGARKVHIMAGIGEPDDPAALASYRRGVAYATERLGEAGLELMLEPINRRDMPGYFLSDFNLAEQVVTELGASHLKLQFDIYHRQVIHGDVTTALRRLMPMIGHVQIASVPSRHEPEGEELNYPFLFEELDRLGYDGFVGCEYRPCNGTLNGLDWLRRLGALG